MATLTKGIKLSKLASMSSQEKARCVDELFQAAVNPSEFQLEEQKRQLDSEIKFYESMYNMSSTEMRQRLANGELSQTADICSWLITLKIRGRFDIKNGSTRA